MSKKLLIVALAVLASSVVVAGDEFTTLDVDNSGSISQAEAAALPSLLEQWTVLDVDENGELNADEFAKYVIK
jgi:hypothetical protein